MIDHVMIEVSNLKKSKDFYEKAFQHLGYKIAFGEEGIFWAFNIGEGLFEIMQSESKKVINTVHIAFKVKNKEQIHKFYEAAIKAGGKDNGKPGPCPEYTKTYYASFVFDLDGHNVEAMIDKPRK